MYISKRFKMKFKKEEIAIVIPAFDEGNTINHIATELKQKGTPIVVDDGSTDQTFAEAKIAGAITIKHYQNLGYDQAIYTGIREAIDLNFKYVFVFDADGQHDPNFIDEAVNCLKNGCDVVVGHRDVKQRFSESVFALVSTVLWGVKDPLCGLKGYRLSAIKKFRLECNRRSIGTDIMIAAIKTGLKVCSVATVTKPRNGVSRFGIGFKVNFDILKALFYGLFFVRPFDK